jgi:hypothetical protein
LARKNGASSPFEENAMVGPLGRSFRGRFARERASSPWSGRPVTPRGVVLTFRVWTANGSRCSGLAAPPTPFEYGTWRVPARCIPGRLTGRVVSSRGLSLSLRDRILVIGPVAYRVDVNLAG